MVGDRHVNDSSTVVRENDKNEEQSERDRRHDEDRRPGCTVRLLVLLMPRVRTRARVRQDGRDVSPLSLVCPPIAPLMSDHSAAPGPSCDAAATRCNDLLHRGGRHDNAKTFQLANNALIAPARIFPCQAKDQRSTFFGNRRTTRPPRVGPVLGHHPAVPTQQCCRRDQKHPPIHARQQLTGRC